MAVKGQRVLVGAVEMLLRVGMSLGIPRAELLEASALDEADLADRDAYLPFARHLELGTAIVRARPGVNVGLAALRQVSPATLGVLGYVITNSATLRDALGAFIRFQRLLTDGARWHLDVRGGVASLTLEADPELERLGHPLVALLGLWLTIGRIVTGHDLRPRAVRFRHRPAGDPAELARFFGATVELDVPDNRLDLAASDLALPLVVGQPALRPSLERLASAKLTEAEGYGSFTQQLRALLFDQLPRGVYTRPVVARRLGVSERTLNRRLREEDTTFREALDSVRWELAEIWLSEPQHAVYEVAFLLGYSEPSTFHRSFRRWTGSSPHAWRQAHR